MPPVIGLFCFAARTLATATTLCEGKLFPAEGNFHFADRGIVIYSDPARYHPLRSREVFDTVQINGYVLHRSMYRSALLIWFKSGELYFKVWDNTIGYIMNDFHCLAFCSLHTYRCIHPVLPSCVIIICRTGNDIDMLRKQILSNG